jgi:acetyl-CoA carboxylase/biotin carboxylase 1
LNDEHKKINKNKIASSIMATANNFFHEVEDFVQFSEGDHAIKKILIANNGIGATKAIISIRRWSFETFGNEKMVSLFIALNLLMQFYQLFC